MAIIKLRARSKDGYFEDIEFDLSVIEQDPTIERDAPIRYRIEVEGHSLSGRFSNKGVSFQNSLDITYINQYKVSNCNISLFNADGFFRTDITDNFWTTNNLNPGGFLNNIKVYVEFFIDGVWKSILFFDGQIIRIEKPLQKVATLVCFSNTTRLNQIQLEGAGIGVPKIVELYPTGQSSQEPVVEGTYAPEPGMVPLTVLETAQAYHHKDNLVLKEVINDALGIKDNTGILDRNNFKAQGGFLGDPILINYKTTFRYKSIRNSFDKLTKLPSNLTTVFSDFEDLPEVEAHISVRENIQFNTEPGRITRLPTAWRHDSATNRLYVLLSNPSEYISDQLVSYHLDTDSYHILHEFNPNLACYSLASFDYDTFYIMCRGCH